jgi:hypothetical protein
VRIIAKDVLKLADDDRAVAPVATSGKLTTTVAVSGTATFTVTTGKGAEYAASGMVAVGDEILGFTRSGDVFTIVSRAQYFTEASAHDIDDAVQSTYEVVTPTLAHNIIYDLLVNYANIDPTLIDKTGWDAEAATWLLDTEFTGIIVEPTGVNELVTELARNATLYIWWDEQDQKIKLRAIRPATYAEILSLDDTSGFLEDTVSVSEKPDERISQVWVYYGIKNPFNAEKTDNYRGLTVTADLDAEGAFKYGEKRITVLWSPWIPNTTPAQATLIGNRYLDKYKDNPRYLKGQIDAKDANIRPGSVVRVSTDAIQTASGLPDSLNMQVVEMKEVVGGTKFELVLTDTFFSGRFFYITPNDAPAFAVATEEQKNTMGFICENTGLMPDGSEGYKII